MLSPALRILPSPGGEPENTPVLERIAAYLKRIADRLDLDAAVFNEMIENGRTVSDRSAQFIERESHHA